MKAQQPLRLALAEQAKNERSAGFWLLSNPDLPHDPGAVNQDEGRRRHNPNVAWNDCPQVIGREPMLLHEASNILQRLGRCDDKLERPLCPGGIARDGSVERHARDAVLTGARHKRHERELRAVEWYIEA